MEIIEKIAKGQDITKEEKKEMVMYGLMVVALFKIIKLGKAFKLIPRRLI